MVCVEVVVCIPRRRQFQHWRNIVNKIGLFFCGFLVVSITNPALAAPIVTTECTTAKGSYPTKQGGKSYTCKSKKTCKTTTCKSVGGISCTIATTNTLSDCTETVSTPNSGRPGSLLIPPRPGGNQLAPTKDKPRFPPAKGTIIMTPATNAPTKDKPAIPPVMGTILKAPATNAPTAVVPKKRLFFNRFKKRKN